MTTLRTSLPKVTFESGWLLDDSVAEIAGKPLDNNALSEMERRLPEFQESWDRHGTQLLETVVSNFDLHFEEQDIKGFLLCGPLYSQSHPLLINVKRYLKSCSATPDSMQDFVEVVFHELLHILLQDRLTSWPTPFIEKFQDEEFEVQAHLHLMSLQRFAHLRLGNDSKVLESWYGSIGTNYAKAWYIISMENNFKTVLDEIPTFFTKASATL